MDPIQLKKLHSRLLSENSIQFTIVQIDRIYRNRKIIILNIKVSNHYKG